MENIPMFLKRRDVTGCCYKEEQNVPEFIVRCVAKIETMMSTVGLYRLNGDALTVGKLR